jgi:hypothetical protein
MVLARKLNPLEVGLLGSVLMAAATIAIVVSHSASVDQRSPQQGVAIRGDLGHMLVSSSPLNRFAAR